jgi:hypothetical protein
MAEFQIALVVVAVNAGVLGIVFFAAYRINKSVKQLGRSAERAATTDITSGED